MTRTSTGAGGIERMAGGGLAATLIALVALVAGCPSESTSQPDAGVTDDGGATGTGGLSLVFLTEITEPDGDGGGEGDGDGGSVADGERGAGWRVAGPSEERYLGVPDDETRVHRVEVVLEEIRAVGDIGAEEEPRLELTWDEADARCSTFAAAQPGKYSQVKANVMSYRITGLTATMTNPDQPFTIQDIPPSGITVVVSVGERSVEIDETTRISVLFRSRAVAAAVDWDDVEVGEGSAVVTGESPQIAAVRAAIAEAMTPADEQPVLECTDGPPGDGDQGTGASE